MLIFSWAVLFSGIFFVAIILVPLDNMVKGVHSDFNFLVVQGAKLAAIFATIFTALNFFLNVKKR